MDERWLGDAPHEIAILGVGGHGREIGWFTRSLHGGRAARLRAWVDDDSGKQDAGASPPVLSWQEYLGAHPGLPVIVAVGDPSIRERLVQRCLESGVRSPTVVHDSVIASTSVRLGEGSVVFPGCILTVDVALARHVQLNAGCILSHDVDVGEFSTLSPGTRVAGNVRIGRRVFIGSGATIINGVPGRPLVIGDDAVVAAGACVTGDVAPRTMVAGVPAVPKRAL